MNKSSVIAIGIITIACALGAGYWLGRQGAAQPAPQAAPAASSAAGAAQKERRILYYRNPMGLADTSPSPKKDPMGMDYLPVYEGEEESAPGTATQVRISSEKIQKLGVRTEAAALRDLARSIRAVGRVEANERLIHSVAPKFEGWIERLLVNTTGQPVRRGQPLLEVYSPELVSAQQEYALAAQGLKTLQNASPEVQAGIRQLAEASLARLKNWDISDEQLQALSQNGVAKRTLTYRSPANGIVLEKKALQGMRFSAGEALYQIVDVSSVWVVADVFEQDLALIKAGQAATVRVNAYPEREYRAQVAYVYPTLNASTRSVAVRLELANPGGLLKPAMYADVEFAAAGKGRMLSVPLSAVLRDGMRYKVLVELAAGRFEPREVRLGLQGDDYVEILAGLGEGEKVVVAANFLIDSESNLKAAVGGFGGHAAHGGGTAPQTAPPPANPAPQAPAAAPAAQHAGH